MRLDTNSYENIVLTSNEKLAKILLQPSISAIGVSFGLDMAHRSRWNVVFLAFLQPSR